MATVTFNPAVGGNGLQVSDQVGEVNSLTLGGHRQFFVPALQQTVSVAGFVVDTATVVGANAAAALASQNAAATSANLAQGSANTAITQATSANLAREQAQLAASQAQASLEATLASASLSGAKAYASFLLANNDKASLSLNQVVFVARDETRNNQGAYYSYNGTDLVFLRKQEFYESPSSNVQSDSVQNMITKLLVEVGVIPAAAPSLAI